MMANTISHEQLNSSNITPGNAGKH